MNYHFLANHFSSSPKCMASSLLVSSPSPRSPAVSPTHELLRTERILKCRSAPLVRPISATRGSRDEQPRRRLSSAKERGVSFKTDNLFGPQIVTDQIFDINNKNNVFSPTPQRPLSSISRASSKTVFLSKTNSVARCTPVRSTTEAEQFKRPGSVSPSPSMTTGDQCGACPRKRVDFVRQLPVQISKKILGYVSENELRCVLVLVSKHWNYLAQQVQKEFILNQIASEDVMMMQVSLR